MLTSPSVQAGHALVKGAISPDATHNDPYNTTEYEMHNLFGLQISNATYHALLSLFPGQRPFTIGRSTFASRLVLHFWRAGVSSNYPTVGKQPAIGVETIHRPGARCFYPSLRLLHL
jgi:hypothetical protein